MVETRSPSLWGIAAIAVIAAAAIAGGFGGSEATEQTETFEFFAEDHSVGEGVVVEMAERGGFSLLGFDLRRPSRYVRVAFTLPNSCDVAGAVDWPVDGADCAGPDGLAGTVAGSGITATGGPILLVEALVEADCFSRIELGASWPPSACDTW